MVILTQNMSDALTDIFCECIRNIFGILLGIFVETL